MARPLDLLAAAVTPDRCLHCRAPARLGALLCDACRRALPWMPVDGCPRCGLPVRCRPGHCPARAAAFAAAWSPLAYEGPARSLALAAKERATERTCRWLAAAIVARVPAEIVAGVEAVVPAPPDPARRRRRGVDHATRLAVGVAAPLGLPVERVLRRRRPQTAQHRSARAERLALPAPAAVGPAPRVALIVDDVHTTGRTLEVAARTLRGAGARRVVAVTALRALR